MKVKIDEQECEAWEMGLPVPEGWPIKPAPNGGVCRLCGLPMCDHSVLADSQLLHPHDIVAMIPTFKVM